MPHSLYVCLQDEDKIAPFTIDADSGRLMPLKVPPRKAFFRKPQLVEVEI
jgi:hypothetical protein